MGGTSLRSSFRLSNLLTTCHRCNLVRIERRRRQSYLSGWLVKQADDPSQVPLLYRGRWVTLDDDGGVLDVERPPTRVE